MHVLITGAAGMIGRKLIERLVRDGGLNEKPIDKLTLVDVIPAEQPQGFGGTVDIAPAICRRRKLRMI
jgi:D-erythronate 2-dehydrogenase